MQEESLRGIIAQFLVAEAEPGVVVDELSWYARSRSFNSKYGQRIFFIVLSSRKGRKDRKGGSFS